MAALGTLPVAAAALAAEAGGVRERRSREVGAPETPATSRVTHLGATMGPGVNPLECSVDVLPLTSALPLQPRDRVIAPVTVHAPQVGLAQVTNCSLPKGLSVLFRAEQAQ